VSISKIVTENHIVPVRGTDMKKSASSMSVFRFLFFRRRAASVLPLAGFSSRRGRGAKKETRVVSSFGARGLLGRHPAVSTRAPYPRGESTRNVDIGGPIF